MKSGYTINDAEWDNREHDWTGKSFYFLPLTYIFYIPLGLGSKLDSLNREARQAGYKILGKMVLIEHGMFKGRVAIEVEKLDNFDANRLDFDDKTKVYTMVYTGSPAQIGQGIKRLTERVVSRGAMSPRSIFYMYSPKTASGVYKTVIFALT
ncbi:MAG: hypothetical protein P9X24_02715 [Candidatus Hatepunaea meridiana]|nr:hypothetical protein [Candidatus Hatepunaea meridiana]